MNQPSEGDPKQDRREQRRKPPMPVNGASVKLLAELAVRPPKKGRRK